MWKLIDGQSLAARAWGEEALVYNDFSGDTHLLGADALQLLLRLRQGGADEDALALALEIEPAEREDLALLLAELSALALIESA